MGITMNENEQPCVIIKSIKEYDKDKKYVIHKVLCVDENFKEFETIVPLKVKVFIPHYASYYKDGDKIKINLTPTKLIRDKSKIISLRYL